MNLLLTKMNEKYGDMLNIRDHWYDGHKTQYRYYMFKYDNGKYHLVEETHIRPDNTNFISSGDAYELVAKGEIILDYKNSE